MTASTLYEAVEPHTVWKQLLNSVLKEILGEASQIEVCTNLKVTITGLILCLGDTDGQVCPRIISRSGRRNSNYTSTYRVLYSVGGY